MVEVQVISIYLLQPQLVEKVVVDSDLSAFRSHNTLDRYIPFSIQDPRLAYALSDPCT